MSKSYYPEYKIYFKSAMKDYKKTNIIVNISRVLSCTTGIACYIWGEVKMFKTLLTNIPEEGGDLGYRIMSFFLLSAVLLLGCFLVYLKRDGLNFSKSTSMLKSFSKQGMTVSILMVLSVVLYHQVANVYIHVLIALLIFYCLLPLSFAYLIGNSVDVFEICVNENKDGFEIYSLFEGPMNDYLKLVVNNKKGTVVDASTNAGYCDLMKQIMREFELARKEGIPELGQKRLNTLKGYINSKVSQARAQNKQEEEKLRKKREDEYKETSARMEAEMEKICRL